MNKKKWAQVYEEIQNFERYLNYHQVHRKDASIAAKSHRSLKFGTKMGSKVTQMVRTSNK